jgi:DNA-binding protein HU-beta
MTKTMLIERLARQGGMTPDQARRALEALFGTGDAPGVLAAALRDGERVQWNGFGTFEARLRKERHAHNPRTHEAIVVRAGAVPVFRAASALRDQVRDAAPTATAPSPDVPPGRLAPVSRPV